MDIRRFVVSGRVAHLGTIVTAVCLLGFTSAALAQAPAKTALDDYVAKADDTFAWTVAATHKEEGYTTFVLDLKSQVWRSPDEVSRTQWEHWVTIVKPDRVKSKTAMLFIGGGGRKTDPPSKPSDIARTLALGTDSIVAELSMVPNQPLVFHKDGKERVEDDLIAYTWMQLMKSGDPTWTARMPMVKSAVRAMDAVQAFTKTDAVGNLPIESFVVSGGSKRGWTTWLTGAVDKRVVAIVPIVIDVLNVRHSMDHHHHAYGFWAPSVGDYVHHKIFEMKDSAAYTALLNLEDPYSYVDRLTMPKFIVNAAGDEFFLPDSSNFYFNELKGEKYLRYVPNANHSLRGSDALESVVAFYNAILTNKPRPKFSWTFEGEDTIRVKTQEKPLAVKVWQATNPKARDFRLETLGPEYRSQALTASGEGEYVAHVERPEQGWTAFFVELAFDSGIKVPFKFTTGVRVTPDTLPFKDKPTTGGE
jgi:PhoPQ-activated pathogenicity-related protein